MLQKNTLLFSRNGMPVVSLAILGDTDPDWRPTGFGYSVWGCEVRIQFPMVKLLDLGKDWAALESNPSVFAIVVMAHLKTHETGNDPDTRKRWKMHLVRMLHKRGYDDEKIRRLFRAMELMMVLPEGLEEEFMRELRRFEEEEAMPVLTQFEKIAMRKGRREGHREGRREGRKEGQAEMLTHQIERKFGTVDDMTRERIAAAETGDLIRWIERVLTADRLEDVFA